MAIPSEGPLSFSSLASFFGISTDSPVKMCGASVPEVGTIIGSTNDTIDKTAPHSISDIMGYVEDYGVEYIQFGTSRIIFTYLAQQSTVEVHSDLSWEVSHDMADQLLIKPTSGTGDATLSIGILSNRSTETRYGTVILQSTDSGVSTVYAFLDIIQHGSDEDTSNELE